MYKSVNPKKSKDIDLVRVFRNLFNLVKQYYYLFIIGIILSLMLAVLYIKKNGKVSEVYTSIIIDDSNNQNNNNNSSNVDNMYTEMSKLLPGNNNIENQMYVLKSYDKAYKTVNRLDMDVYYFNEEGYFRKQIFEEAPFKVVINKSLPQLVGARFYIEILDDYKYKVSISCSDGDIYNYLLDKGRNGLADVEYEGVHKYGEYVKSDFFCFHLIKNMNYSSAKEFSFVMNNPHKITNLLRGNLKIQKVTKNGGVVRISMKTKVPEQGVKILKTFTEVYFEDNLNKKNAAVDKMINFIESQFDNVATSLKASEDKMQYYQSRKNVVDLAAQGQIIIQQVNALENEKSQISSKLVYLDDLKNNLVNGEQNASIVAPSVMGIQDVVLNNLVNTINTITIDRSALCASLNNPKANPQVIAMDAKLTELKKSLSDNVDNIISQIKIFSEDIDKRIRKNRRLLKEMPSKQRGMVNMQRNNEINSQLYSQLLERKLNYYIMKASNILNKDVIEEARISELIPLESNTKLILIFALFWGIMLPLIGVVLFSLFDNRIKGKSDVQEITSHPLLGTIPRIKKENDRMIINNALSAFSDSYRQVRYRVGNMCNGKNGINGKNELSGVNGKDRYNGINGNKGKTCTKIMVTSSLPQEGKTLTSINIASTYAMIKKKVVVIGFDLRKPRLASAMNIKNNIGLSSYLQGECNVDDIIISTDNEYLDVIVSGDEPENPAELIESKELLELVSRLEKRYDYIIIDTPPVGMVSDAILLGKHVDLKLLIVRSGKTHKKAFEETVNKFVDEDSQNIGIIINGAKGISKKYYGYKYSNYRN